MAVSYGTIQRTKIAPQKWMTVTPVTLDSSYAAGGEAFTANGLGLGQIDSIIGVSCDDGYQLVWNTSTSSPKLVAMASIVGLTESVTKAACTDVTTTGTKDFANTIPATSHILGWRATIGATPFSGDTSATISVGVSGDLDRFSADTTQSAFTAAAVVGSASLAADALDTMSAAITPRVTITTAADFTNTTTGASLSMTIYYCSTSGGLIEAGAGTDLSAVVGYVTAIGR